VTVFRIGELTYKKRPHTISNLEKTNEKNSAPTATGRCAWHPPSLPIGAETYSKAPVMVNPFTLVGFLIIGANAGGAWENTPNQL